MLFSCFGERRNVVLLQATFEELEKTRIQLVNIQDLCPDIQTKRDIFRKSKGNVKHIL